MKRAGFTMIELIFVIVILGILSAVALPKLIGVKEQADEGLVKGFVGTLNRTVGPSKWSASIMNGDDGQLNGHGASGKVYDINTSDTDFPGSFSISSLNIRNCIDANTTTGSANNIGATKDNKYYLFCRDGNASSAPRFWYSKTNSSVLVSNMLDNKLKI